MKGQTISHYLVLEQLGEGGSAVVYRAEDLSLGREVALKILPPEFTDYSAAARFQHEARTASSLNHPNICTIYEVGEYEGRHFLAMELLTGQVLSRTINGRALESDLIIELAMQIADALDAAHAANIVHRDIKPANIFITDRDQVKLLDFGLAMPTSRRPLGRKLGSTGGTIPYMSPEQARGEDLDHRTDLFSVGTVLYEMATGHRPFVGASPSEVMEAIVSHPHAPVREQNPAIPTELERIIDKALEKSRKLRFQTASDMHVDLRRLKRELDSFTTLHARTHMMPNARVTTSGRWRARVAAVLGGIAMAGGGMYAIAAVKDRVAPNRRDAGSQPPTAASGGDIALHAEHERAAAPQPTADAPPPLVATRIAPSTSATSRRTDATVAADRPATPPAEPDKPAAAVVPRVTMTEELRIARQKIEMRLYDQALETLRPIAAQSASRGDAVEAGFLMAAVHETRGATDDAMGTYLEIASRHPDDARAPEALVRLAEATLKSKRRDKEAEARRTLTDVVEKYPASVWAPRALVLRGDIEERLNLYQRDETLNTSVPTALVTYRQVVQRYGASGAAATALSKLARSYADMKRFDLAATTYEDLANRDEENRFDAWFAAAELYDKRLKDPIRARDTYARVPSSSPRYGDAQKRLKK